MIYIVPAVFVALVAVSIWRIKAGYKSLLKLAGSWRKNQIKDVFRVKWFLTFFSLIIILAGVLLTLFDVAPKTEYEPDETVGSELVFLLDISRSMLAEDVGSSRLGLSADIIRSITERARGVLKGLAVFKGSGLVVSPITEDNEAIFSYLENISPDMLTSRGTNLEKGIEAAIKAFSDSRSKNKYLFIFTDGEALEGNAAKLANKIISQNIELIIIGVGTEGGANISADDGIIVNSQGQPVISKLDQDYLKQLAQALKGSYVNIQMSSELSEYGKMVYGDKDSFREVKSSRYRLYLLISLLGLFVYFGTRVIKWKDCF